MGNSQAESHSTVLSCHLQTVVARAMFAFATCLACDFFHELTQAEEVQYFFIFQGLFT